MLLPRALTASLRASPLVSLRVAERFTLRIKPSRRAISLRTSVSIRFSYNVQMQPLVNVRVVSGRRSALQACAFGLLQ